MSFHINLRHFVTSLFRADFTLCRRSYILPSLSAIIFLSFTFHAIGLLRHFKLLPSDCSVSFYFCHRFMPAVATIFTDKNKDHVFLHNPCIYNLYSIANHLPSILVHSVLMSHLLHNLLTPHQICFSFLSP